MHYAKHIVATMAIFFTAVFLANTTWAQGIAENNVTSCSRIEGDNLIICEQPPPPPEKILEHISLADLREKLNGYDFTMPTPKELAGLFVEGLLGRGKNLELTKLELSSILPPKDTQLTVSISFGDNGFAVSKPVRETKTSIDYAIIMGLIVFMSVLSGVSTSVRIPLWQQHPAALSILVGAATGVTVGATVDMFADNGTIAGTIAFFAGLFTGGLTSTFAGGGWSSSGRRNRDITSGFAGIFTGGFAGGYAGLFATKTPNLIGEWVLFCALAAGLAVAITACKRRLLARKVAV